MHAKNGTIRLKNGSMDYIRYGSGEKTLILLPGLGSSLHSIRISTLPLLLACRGFGRHYTVYFFSRKHPLQEGCCMRDLAADQIQAMDALGIERADLIGISMGGMISQELALNYTDRIGKLVLCVTCAGPNPLITQSIDEWMRCARQNDHAAMMESNLHRIYSRESYRKYRCLLPLAVKLARPKSYGPFLLQAQACRKHDALDRLAQIRNKTLVIGGEQDAALGSEPSRQIADAIPGARLKMYPRGGHGLYIEEKDFPETILRFLLEAQ